MRVDIATMTDLPESRPLSGGSPARGNVTPTEQAARFLPDAATMTRQCATTRKHDVMKYGVDLTGSGVVAMIFEVPITEPGVVVMNTGFFAVKGRVMPVSSAHSATIEGHVASN